MRSFRVRPGYFTAAATLLFASQCVFAQILTVATWTAESNWAGAHFGAVVANAGDVNGDGFADVIVGAPVFTNGQSQEGRASVYLGGPNGPAATPVWTVESNRIATLFGDSVAGAGDVNGDGFDDVIVGAPAFNNGEFGEGGAFLFLGGPNGPAATAVWGVDSNQVDANFGTSVASAGDVNGDGFADIIVGAAGFDNPEINEGRAFLYLGGPNGPAAAPVWTAESNQAAAAFGWSVASAGDVNGDGLADVIVGAFTYSNGEPGEGRAYVYHGKSSGGLYSTPAWIGEPNVAYARYGFSVASAGDVNDDGYADVLVGAYQYHQPEDAEGAVFAYLGGPAGLASTPAWTVEGNQVGRAYGGAVASAGDLNADGYSDVIVSAVGNYPVGVIENVDIYLGSGSGLSTAPAWTAESDQSNQGFGGTVAGGGDGINDTYPYVLVGEPLYDNGQVNEGRVFAYLFGADSDVDGVADSGDNCKMVVNPAQLDADHDGYGNICDGDINNSGTVTTADYALMRTVLGLPASANATAAAADMNGSGTVTTADVGLLRAQLGLLPGPSGLTCAGTIPCP